MKKNIDMIFWGILLLLIILLMSAFVILVLPIFTKQAINISPVKPVYLPVRQEIKEIVRPELLDEIEQDLEWIRGELARYEKLSKQTGLPAGVLWCMENHAELYGFSLCESIARAEAESNFDPEAVGINRDKNGKIKSVDVGLMQINSKTAPWLWKQVFEEPYNPQYEIAEKIYIDEKLFDPYISVKLGSWYYFHLLHNHKDFHKANTAYNRGDAGLEKWMANRGTARSPYSEKIMNLSKKWEGMKIEN